MAVSAETCVNVSQAGARQFEVQQHAPRQLLEWHADCRSDNGNDLMQPESQSISVVPLALVQCSVRASVRDLGYIYHIICLYSPMVGICMTCLSCVYRQVSSTNVNSDFA